MVDFTPETKGVGEGLTFETRQTGVDIDASRVAQNSFFDTVDLAIAYLVQSSGEL